MTDREPQPGDGPEYHADRAFWQERQRRALGDVQMPTHTLGSVPRAKPTMKNRVFRESDAKWDAAQAIADAELENISDVLRRALDVYIAGGLRRDLPTPTHHEEKA